MIYKVKLIYDKKIIKKAVSIEAAFFLFLKFDKYIEKLRKRA